MWRVEGSDGHDQTNGVCVIIIVCIKKDTRLATFISPDSGYEIESILPQKENKNFKILVTWETKVYRYLARFYHYSNLLICMLINIRD